jgi:hypothetical protein
VPEETVSSLLLEYQIYRVCRLYRCPRSQAVHELQLDNEYPAYERWAVQLHLEFAALEDRVSHARA